MCAGSYIAIPNSSSLIRKLSTMKACLISLLLLCSCFANAQKGTKKPEPIIFKTFRMPKFPIADFPKRSIPVSDIQVIQMLRDSIRMGYGMKGMDNQIVVLVPEKPLTYFLQEHIYKMYLNDFKEGGVQVLWVIKDLRVGEKTSFNEYAYTRFNADAYISRDLVLYKPVCSIDTVLVAESGSDVTAWHGEDIENALKILLKRTLIAGKDLPEKISEGVTFEQIRNSSKQQTDFPILNDAVYNEGVYANFEEFLQNKPTIIDYRMVVVEKKRIQFLKAGPDNKIDTLNVWGLCKNGEIYKYADETLIPIEKQAKGFIISDYVEKANRRNGNLFFAAFIGGLVGGVVGGVAVGMLSSSGSGRTLLVRSIPYITKAKKQPEASCIDMRTGELSF